VVQVFSAIMLLWFGVYLGLNDRTLGRLVSKIVTSQVRGTWGYVDRSATDPESLTAILNSKSAVLMLALALYKKRYGVNVDGVAQVTGAGVVITPRDKSTEYWSLVELYRRHL
jgi:sulfite exporter TauE/SafE